MDLKTARSKFNQQKAGAKQRGIGFKLTFEQWLGIWGDKLDERGRRYGSLMMCRIADKGDYEVGNVFIGNAQRNANSRVAADFNKLGKDHPQAVWAPPVNEDDDGMPNLGYSTVWR